jgi:membrane protease YdiL (CAAX protease family)
VKGSMAIFIDRIRERPLGTCYGFVFAISWGGFLALMGGPGGIPAPQAEMLRMMPRAVTALLAGPFIAGLLMIGLVHGRGGFRDLFLRLRTWRAGLRWYAVVLLTAPLALLALPLAVSPIWPQFLPRVITEPDKAAIFGLAFGAGLSTGLFEEIGWTGFAVPMFLRRRSVLATGLTAGFLWGLWHLVVNLWSSGDASGRLASTLFLHSFAFSFAVLPAFRILMVLVYARTQSLFQTMLMHLGLTAGNVIFVPHDVSGPAGPVWSLLVAVPLWAAAAILSRQRSPSSP